MAEGTPPFQATGPERVGREELDPRRARVTERACLGERHDPVGWLEVGELEATSRGAEDGRRGVVVRRPLIPHLGAGVRHRPSAPEHLDLDVHRAIGHRGDERRVHRGSGGTWSPSSTAIARAASAVTTPPWGNGRRFHDASISPE
jgi:hypothetical protein